MELEGTVLSDISKTQKDKHSMISLIRGIKTKHQKPKLMDTENRLFDGCQRQGAGGREKGGGNINLLIF